MEFHEKLQELRKQKQLTQEELAEALYVSRTAVSKWESGRGYPNIDSLKAIASFFSVTIDDLLSSGEMLSLAEEDNKQSQRRLRDLVFGILDLSVAMFFFLPFFGQATDGGIQEVSLLQLTEIAPYLKIGYMTIVLGSMVCGLFILALQACAQPIWIRIKSKLSLALNVIGTILFIISLQPYGATLLFLFLTIKVCMLVKR